MTVPTERVSHDCSACGVIDTDPRHSGLSADGSFFERHMDCCAALGCAICQDVMTRSGNAKGAALINFLTSGA